jgi:phenylalanyl-tRNA synthetase beta chain
VTLRRSRIAHLLGATVGDSDVTRIFAGLGFDVADTPDGWRVRVPTMRVDVLREADLIEEVARHHGYDRVPPAFPALRDISPRPEPRMARKSLLRHVLTAAGFSEAVTWSFISASDAAPFADPGEPPVRLAYPLSEKFAVLRPSLLPGLVECVAHNRRHDRRDVRLFEIGACVSAARGERHRLAFALTGAGASEHWAGGHRLVDFFDARGVAERIAEALKLPLTFAATSSPFLQPGRAASCSARGEAIGVVGQLVPAQAEARGLSGGDDIYVAEFDLDAVERLVPNGDAQFEAVPRFPAIVRDISIVVAERVPAETLRATIRQAAPPTLAAVCEFDRYTGAGIPEGCYSLSLRLTFRSPERTLTDLEVQAAMGGIMEALAREHRAVQR